MNLLRITLLATALAGCFSLPLAAQDYLPPTERIPAALQQHPEVGAARARVEAARAHARALSVGGHLFEASVSPTRRRVDGEGDFHEWEAELSRGIRLPGKARLDRELGALGLRQAELALEQAQRDTAHRLLDAWMDWLRAAADAEILQQQHASLGDARRALARQVEVGDAARLDLDLMEADLAIAGAAALRAARSLEQTQRRLASEFPQVPLPARIPALPEPQAPDTESSDLLQRILHQAPQREAAELAARQQDAIAERARADRRPDPSIGLRVMDERNGEERGVGLVFTVPFGGRHQRALSDAARAEADAQHDDSRGRLQALARDTVQTLAEAGTAHAQWQAQAAALAATGAAATRTRRAWELGEIAVSERLLAERRHAEAAQQERLARADALQAALRLRIDGEGLWHAPRLDADALPD